MNPSSHVRRAQARYGKEDLILETGRLAKQADGSVMVQYGGTVVLVCAVAAKEPREGVNFLPLTVEYQEKTYAAGKIPGGFFKREGRPSQKEILTARLIDRPIRSLFPNGFCNDVQVMAMVLSHDLVNNPDVIAIIGASAALGLAGLPVKHRVGACRVGRVGGQFVLNPTYKDLDEGDLDLVVACTSDGILMVEAGAKEIPEETMIEAMRFAEEHGQEVIRLQEDLLKQVGVSARTFPISAPDPGLIEKVRQHGSQRLKEIIQAQVEKESFGDGMSVLAKEIFEKLQTPEGTPTQSQVQEALGSVEKQLVREAILQDGRRVDGRDFVTVRPITCEVGVLPRTHGSGLFTRGQTQSMVATTLGTAADEQMIDALEGKTYKSFMLHYNFPSFSVGEVRPIRGPGRREIGHGALAERSLSEVMPTKEKFPYTVRVVSEILESNGSSSMATVCGTTLSLMDAGVPIKAPVSGVAMGLVKDDTRYQILTDIIGLEDHFGDMDFKVAGTQQGITALQLDLKLTGVPLEILTKALIQAKEARAFILGEMLKVLAAPRTELSVYAPRITVLKINPEMIGQLIGPGGKMIRKITQESGATIDVEDDGTVMVASSDPASSKKAVDFIKGLTEEAEIGRVYDGVVTRVMNFGAFFEIAPGKEGLCHVSELSNEFVPKVEDVVKVGDHRPVKVVEVDAQGRINLSHKQALLPPGTPPVAPARRSGPPSRGPGGDRGGPRGGPPSRGPRREFRREGPPREERQSSEGYRR